MCIALSSGFPQTPIDSESVVEVRDPVAKRLIFDNFRTQGRSVLYDSLPGLNNFPKEGDVIADIVIEVESPVLQLFKPRDAGKKLKERAEARRAEEEDQI